MKSKNILVAEDESTTRLRLVKVLEAHNYHVDSAKNGVEALNLFQHKEYQVIISDFSMPGLDGGQFLQQVRKENQDVCFILLTSSKDVKLALEIGKNGADDFISKPFNNDELLFRIVRAQEQRQTRLEISNIQQEKQLLDLEHKKLVNWRSLYATKDIRQTEQMTQLLSRTINQAGGFLWLELLKDCCSFDENGTATLDSEIIHMVIHSAESQKKIFEYLTFLGNLKQLELNFEPSSLEHGYKYIKDSLISIAKELYKVSKKPIFIQELPIESKGSLHIDKNYLKSILKEVLINSIKYSPKDATIHVNFHVHQTPRGEFLEIIVVNPPMTTQKLGSDGNRISGIPYEYSELIFDLFYTLEGFPTYHELEDWVDGTGLFICREIIKKHGGWIQGTNGIDYTGDTPKTLVRITLALPVKAE
jgi:DNA-binding response OmpR family regulator